MLSERQEVIYAGIRFPHQPGAKLIHRGGLLYNGEDFFCAVSDLPAGDLLDSRTRQPIEVDNSNRSYVAPDSDDMFGGEPGSAYVNQ